MNPQVEHTDVGAYALGLLEARDRMAFEAHLARCRSCAAELAGFAGLHGLLMGVEPGPPERQVPDDLVGMMRRRKAADRRGRQARVMMGAAAAVVLLAGGVTAGVAVTAGSDNKPQPTAASGLGPGERRTATNQATGATGTVALQAKRWGTEVALDLAGIRGPLECELVAITKTGRKRVVAGWAVPPKGYGVAGSPDHLVVHGGVASPPADITRFVVRVSTGDDLLTIPV